LSTKYRHRISTSASSFLYVTSRSVCNIRSDISFVVFQNKTVACMCASIHTHTQTKNPCAPSNGRTHKSSSTYIQPVFLPEIERYQASEISLLVSMCPTLQCCTSQPIFTKLVMTARISCLSTTHTTYDTYLCVLNLWYNKAYKNMQLFSL